MNQSDETVEWLPMAGKLKGYSCKYAGQQMGMVMKAMRAGESGWSSSYGGFYADESLAKQSHVEAAKAKLEQLKIARASQTVSPSMKFLTMEQQCKAAGIRYTNYRALSASKLDAEREQLRSKTKFGPR